MISIALIFGAPETVPAGKAARSASSEVQPSRRSPLTVDEMCMTCEYRSTSISFSTWTVPGRATRPTSLRPRSTSITCSARSFASLSSSFSRRLSSAGSAPRRRVPASGLVSTRRPSTWTSFSGDVPTTWRSPPRARKNMYGDGLIARRHR